MLVEKILKRYASVLRTSNQRITRIISPRPKQKRQQGNQKKNLVIVCIVALGMPFRKKQDVTKEGLCVKRFVALSLVLVVFFLVPVNTYASGINVVSRGFSNGLAVIEQDGKYGYMSTDGSIVIPPQWEYAESFSEGLAAVKVNGKYGFIDTSGAFVVKPKWKDVTAFQNGFAAVQKGKKWGVIDAVGNVVSKPKWDECRGFSCGVAVVKKKDKYGFIDTTGRLLGKVKWNEAYSHSNNLAAVFDGKHWGYVDTAGEIVIQPQYASCQSFSDGLAWVAMADIKGEKKYGAINIQGEKVVDFKYNWRTNPFSEGYAVADDGEQRYVIDKAGKIVFNAELSSTGNSIFSVTVTLASSAELKNGLFEIEEREVSMGRISRKYGLCDAKGNIVVEPKWDMISVFYDGFAMIKDEHDKYGYINTNGRVVVSPQYDDAGYFKDGFAIVWKGKTWYIIDESGRIII